MSWIMEAHVRKQQTSSGEIKDFWLVVSPRNWNHIDSEVAFERVILIFYVCDIKGEGSYKLVKSLPC